MDIDSILAKGLDMTTSEFKYLYNQKVSQTELRKALKMQHPTFTALVGYLELMPREKGSRAHFTKEEYLELKKELKTKKAVMDALGITHSTLYRKLKEWGLHGV